jgi:hypothetical protein
LFELVEITGLLRPTLYKIETSGVSLTWDKLIDLAGGHLADLVELFDHGTDS